MIVTGWIARNNYLSLSEMQNNATIIYNYLKPLGWTTNAICGLLGNMQAESTINPQLYQGRRVPAQGAQSIPWGYGLVQWTPATKMIWWASEQNLDWGNGYVQLSRILYEVSTWSDRYNYSNALQWICPSRAYDEDKKKYYCTYTLVDWTQSTASPYELAIDFMNYYERPDVPNGATRGNYAEYWYKYFTGGTSGTVAPLPPQGLPNTVIYSPKGGNQHRLPVYMLLKRDKSKGG